MEDKEAAFSDYLVFVDESGDHNLTRVDPDFPVFVLLFGIVAKPAYNEQVCPALQRFKFAFWGHDEVVLHEHEIRKPRGHFAFLQQQALREPFLQQLSGMMAAFPATLIAVIIDKQGYINRYANPVNPYDYAMETGLERVYRHLQDLGQPQRRTSVIVECRGRREDAELELAFRRVCDGENYLRKNLPFNLVMVPKAANSPGLQLVDLMARPIALNHIRPEQPNRAYALIEPKFRRSPGGKVEGWGIKRLP